MWGEGRVGGKMEMRKEGDEVVGDGKGRELF